MVDLVDMGVEDQVVHLFSSFLWMLHSWRVRLLLLVGVDPVGVEEVVVGLSG